MHCLVTGGAGFLGTHLVQALLKAGHSVEVLDDLSGGFRENVPSTVVFHHTDVADASAVEAAFSGKRFDVVFHFAAYAAEGLSHFVRQFNYVNNIAGSANIINECVRTGVGRLVYASSIAVYGAAAPPMHEHMIPMPEDPYGIAKRAVELDIAAADAMFGLDHVVFRPHNVYGELQNLHDPYRNVIGIFSRAVLEGRPMPVYGDGLQTRAFTYVGDIVPLIVEAAGMEAASRRTFNIGADHHYTVLDLARSVAEAFGVPLRIEHLPARHEVRHAYSDHTHVREVFGAGNETSLSDGLSRMAEWARSVELRPPRSIELELPLSLART